jgi:hypothetical protein
MRDPSGMSSRSCVFSLLKAGFLWRACQCRRLPSAFETSGPLGTEDISWQKICFPVDLLLVIARTTQQLLAEFWTPADPLPYSPDLNSYSPDLNLLDFSIQRVLLAKGQAVPHIDLTTLRPSITADWDWIVVVYICKNCHSLCHRR